MDLHQIGTAGGVTNPQQEQQQSLTSTPSSSTSPSAKQHLHHLQQPRHIQHHHQHHSQQQHQHQLYNLLPPQPFSPTITLPPIATNTININTNSQYLDTNDEEIPSSSSWPRSRDLQHQHQSQSQLYQPQQSNIKRETMGKNPDAGNPSSNARNPDDSMPSTSDFVKKLYKMLGDPSFQDVVSWGPLGDCFVVKDMNEFTKSILPRMFKHSNFASFVRQLNKYDFHKVKNTDDNMFGEHSWTFRHPDFHADRRESLENIKRKVPAQRKTSNIPNSTTTSLSSSTSNNNNHHLHHHSSSSPSMHHNPHSHSHYATTSSPYPRRSPSPTQSHTTPNPNPNPYHLKQEISELKSRLVNLESNFETRFNNLETNYETRLNNLESVFETRLRGLEMAYEGRMRGLEKNYESVLVELVAFQRGVAQQDGVVKSLIRCFLGEDSERSKQKASSGITVNQNLTTMTTAGLLLPSASTSTGPVRMEDRLGQYHQEALAQIMEYGREGLGKRKNSGDERVVDGGGDGDERGKRKRRDSDTELELGKASLTSQQQQTFRQLTTSSTSTGPSTSVPWSSPSTMTNNINGNTLSFVPFGEDEEDSPSSPSSSLTTNVNEGLHVYTVGHLMPRNTLVDERLGSWSLDANGFSGGGGANTSSKDLGNLTCGTSETVNGGDEGENVEIVPPGMPTTGPSPSVSTPTISSTTSTPLPSSSSLPVPPSSSPSSSQQKLRVRRATFVPGGWAVPPRVLLVDDDAVIRKLSSKFLKIFGCTTDVAVDGIGAVTKMNLEKYDLVLMDILMPKLDGISATNLIRKFDRGTPIISMTVNSKPDEIMEYYSSGMNDILPKPFTKEGLLDILEKHLMHLKVIQQMTVIPRSVGVPPLSDANFEQVLMTNAMMVQQQQQMQQRHCGTPVAGRLVSGNTTDGLSTSTNAVSLSSLPLAQQQQLVSQQQQPSQISFTSLLAMGEEDGKNVNPLAGMGLSDEHYNMILQNLVNGERFMGMGMDGGNSGGGVGSGGMKRSIDDVGFGGSERGGKRSRFEVIE